jgi:hypothetical protein
MANSTQGPLAARTPINAPLRVQSGWREGRGSAEGKPTAASQQGECHLCPNPTNPNVHRPRKLRPRKKSTHPTSVTSVCSATTLARRLDLRAAAVIISVADDGCRVGAAGLPVCTGLPVDTASAGFLDAPQPMVGFFFFNLSFVGGGPKCSSKHLSPVTCVRDSRVFRLHDVSIGRLRNEGRHQGRAHSLLHMLREPATATTSHCRTLHHLKSQTHRDQAPWHAAHRH